MNIKLCIIENRSSLAAPRLKIYCGGAQKYVASLNDTVYLFTTKHLNK